RHEVGDAVSVQVPDGDRPWGVTDLEGQERRREQGTRDRVAAGCGREPCPAGESACQKESETSREADGDATRGPSVSHGKLTRAAEHADRAAGAAACRGAEARSSAA